MTKKNIGPRANNQFSASRRGWKRLLYGLAPVVAVTLALNMGSGLAHAADGDLDTTFGGTGKVTTSFTWPSSGESVAIQSNGKIVVAGYTMGLSLERDFAVARYNSNGTLDTTFDGDGKVTTDFGGNEQAYAVAVQPDAKIVVVGSYTPEFASIPDFAIARYTSNGAPDTTFSGDGELVVDLQGALSEDTAHAVAIHSNGKIVVAGYSRFLGPNPSKDFALIRLNTNGTLDTGFDGDGIQTTDFGGDEVANTIAIQPDAKVVVGGNALIAGGQDFALARYNTNGALDNSFDTDGKVTTDISAAGTDRIEGLALSADGRIVAAGSISFGSSGAFAIARYESNGILDLTLDGDGRVTTSFGGPAFGQAVVIQSDSKIVVAGYSDTGATNNDFVLARYISTGALDTTFSGDGKVFTDFSNNDDFGRGVALQADGKLVVAGSSATSFAVARYQYSPASTPTPTRTSTPTSAPASPTTMPSSTPVPPTSTSISTPGGSTATSTSVPPTSTSVSTPGGTTSTPVPPTSTSVSTPGGSTATPASTSVPTVCPMQFSDAAEGSTFYSHIRCLACRNILSGYADGTFKPGNNITRGQLSKIVSNAAGYTEEHTAQSFEDVPVGSTFHQFVERMYSRGIISGYNCGGASEPCNAPNSRPYFRVNANATRGQIAKIVSNAAGYSDTPVGQQFEDVPTSHPFYVWIGRISSRGIISGYGCGGAEEQCVAPDSRPYFRPQNDATRGQVSKIIANTFYPNCVTP